MAHAKKQRRKENREPVCVMLGAEHLFRNSHSHPSGRRSDRGIEVGNHSPFAVCQSLKFHVRYVVARGVVGFAVGG